MEKLSRLLLKLSINYKSHTRFIISQETKNGLNRMFAIRINLNLKEVEVHQITAMIKLQGVNYAPSHCKRLHCGKHC
jgi:phosphopantetheine adenylyltransferase